MIGNDVVDLAKSSKSWQEKRFQAKVYSAAEQDLISRSTNRHQMAWLLWSMKEAAYKIFVQQKGIRSFHPTQLKCCLKSTTTGTVTFDQHSFFTTSTLAEGYIHTIARLNTAVDYQSEVVEIEDGTYEGKRQFLRRSFIKTIAEKTGFDLPTLAISKNSVGVPFVLHNNHPLPIRFSFTHCGNYGGYAYLD